jgi:ankyrin repeat protein
VEAIVALLKEDEAAAAETDPEGRTPLHFALSFFPAKVPAVAEGQHAGLLEVGTLVRASDSAPGSVLLSKDHLVPGMFAPFGGCLGKVQKVIKHARNPYKVTLDIKSIHDFEWYEREELVLSDGVSAVPEVLEALLAAAPETLRQRDGGGRLPLHYAAGGAVSGALFLKLLHAGAPEDASLRDDKGFLPLHYAAIERAPPAKVEALLGAPGVDACVWEHSMRLTPLHFACEFGAPQESTLAILQKGLPAAGQFSLARSLPLHHACGLPPAVVGPLLAAFPDAARERTVDGSLALHCLVSSPNANLESVQLVLGAFPAAILEKNEAGETALLLACKHQAPLPLIKHLHALHPAAIREKNEQGHFPAHFAVQAAHAPVQPALVSFLATENKIAFKAVDSEGMTPLHLAVNILGAEKEVLMSVAALFKEVVSQGDNKVCLLFVCARAQRVQAALASPLPFLFNPVLFSPGQPAAAPGCALRPLTGRPRDPKQRRGGNARKRRGQPAPASIHGR